MSEDNMSDSDLMPTLPKPKTMSKHNKHSMRRLQELKFDPMEEMVILARKTDAELVQLRFNRDGSYKEKYSTMAYAQLLATKQKLINDLMRYGYARMPEGVTQEPKAGVTGLTINLSKKGDNYLDTTFEMVEEPVEVFDDFEKDEQSGSIDIRGITINV